ncbi:MAG: CPBP family intramembrane metalloprotease [Lachnospiraceae bacterium]|nr:CPBP family intramembrane metalloprotease [Candidatus Merdinaster equi]
MKKIIQHPAFDVVLTLVIGWLLIHESWYVSYFLLITLPNFWGIDLFTLMGEDLAVTWAAYFEFIDIWIVGLIIFALFKKYRPMFKVFSPKMKGNNIKATLLGGLSLGVGLNLILVLSAIGSGAIQIHYVGLGIWEFILLFTAVLVQSGAEELVTRVFVYQRLRKNFPKWPAIAIFGNGLFFVIIHIGVPGMSLVLILVLIAISIMYSLVVYYFDSIWITIVAHATWNFTQNIIFGLPNTGMVVPLSMFKLDAGTNNFAYDVNLGVEGTVFALILCSIVCVGIYFLGKKKCVKETNIWKDDTML